MPALALSLMWAWPAGAAGAADTPQDSGPLLDALSREGMGQLLDRLLERQPPADPVAVGQAQVAQHRLNYVNPDLPFQRRVESLHGMIDALRQLIRDFPQHEQRPTWQTDLAEALLVDELQFAQRGADRFYEFGIPTDEQRQAVQAAADEALKALQSAAQRLAELEQTLPQEPDHVQKRVQTGLWFRLMEEYAHKRMPYYLAQAAYLSALVSQEADGGESDHAQAARLTAPLTAQSRQLLELSRDTIEPFAQDAADTAGLRVAAVGLAARILVRLGQPRDALTLIRPELRQPRRDLYDLLARLTQARAMAQLRQFDTAAAQLGTLADHPLVRQSPLDRLLVADLAHRVLLERGRLLALEPHQAAQQADQPYLAILDDPSLGSAMEPLWAYMRQRWAQQHAQAQPADEDLSPLLRLALGEQAQQEAQALLEQARAASTASSDSAAEPLQARVAQVLEQALAWTQPLVENPALPAVLRARAMHVQALARYQLAPRQVENLLNVAAIWVKLARQMPDQPLAQTAIAQAMQVLEPLHRMQPQPEGVDAAYRQAAEVLFDRFPVSPAADAHRVYYAQHVLEADSRYQEAVAMYQRVPPEHPDYFLARRCRLYAMQQMLRDRADSTPPDEQLRQRVLEAAHELAAQAQAAAENDADPARRASARVALAAAGMVQAELAAGSGQVDHALATLAAVEAQVASQAELAQDVRRRRAATLVQAGRLDEAASLLMQLMQSAPDDAAALAQQVIADIGQRIETLRDGVADADAAQVQELAQAAVKLADALAAWAQERSNPPAPQPAYELLRGRARRWAGHADQAVRILSPLVQASPDDAQLLHALAGALIEVGDESSLVQAAKHCDRIITGLGPPYPPLWWQAWVWRLRINSQLGQNTRDIPLRVRQLRLTDPELGGPPYRQALEELERRHADPAVAAP